MAIEEDKLPIELLKLFVVVATLELNVFVVVATDEDKEPILELKPLVVVATELDKLKILELSTNVVVATDELKEPIDELIEPLNVEYPVVPVINICPLPLTRLEPIKSILPAPTEPLIICPPFATLTYPATGVEKYILILLLSIDSIFCGNIILLFVSQIVTIG